MPTLDDSIHPDLARALDRDGLNLTRISELVGLDYRTVKRWGVDDATSRAPAFRRLESWIAGRSRAVESDGTWELEELGESVPRADVVALVASIDQCVEQLRSQASAMLGASAGAPKFDGLQKSSTLGLRAENDPARLATMNAETARAVVDRIKSRYQGQLVHFAQRVQPDTAKRLDRAAMMWGVKPSDALRIAIEIALPDPGDAVS